MENMDYLKDRLQGQIDWYSAKSSLNKTYFWWFQSIVIILAALIPLLSGYTQRDSVLLIPTIGVIGFIVSLLSSFLALFKFQEKWIHYRSTSESLQREKLLFQARIEPYDADDPLSILIKRTESILSKENLQWSEFSQKQANN